jgi:hypothetical protein
VQETRFRDFTCKFPHFESGAEGIRTPDLRRAKANRELVEEPGRALEEGYLDWCAVLQGYLIPRIEAECLRARRAGL